MKYKHLIVPALAVVAIVAGFVYIKNSAQAGAQSTEQNEIATARIGLKKPVALDTLLASRKAELNGAVLQSSITVNGQELQEFYVLDTAGQKDIKRDYLENRKL